MGFQQRNEVMNTGKPNFSCACLYLITFECVTCFHQVHFNDKYVYINTELKGLTLAYLYKINS